VTLDIADPLATIPQISNSTVRMASVRDSW